MRHRTNLLTLSCVVLMLVATACQTPTAQKPDPQSTGSVATTVRVTYQPGFPETVALDLLIHAFQAEHPDYRVEKVEFERTRNPNSEALEVLSEGKADVILLGRFDTKPLLPLLEPLEPLISKSSLDLKPYGESLSGLRLEGQLYQLPYQLLPAILIYNKEIFKNAGISVPQDRWSWEQFREAVRKVTSDVGQTRMWGLHTAYPELLARAYVEEKTGTSVLRADPDSVGESLRFFADFVFTDRSLDKPSLQNIQRNGRASIVFTDDSIRRLNQKQTAMALVNSTLVGSLPYMLTVPWALAPMPSSSGRIPVSAADPLTLGLAKASASSQVAWEFIQFAAGPEGAKVLATNGYRPAYVTDEVRTAWTQRTVLTSADMDTVWQTRLVPINANDSDTAYRLLMFRRAVNQTLSGNVPWETALAEFMEDRANSRP